MKKIEIKIESLVAAALLKKEILYYEEINSICNDFINESDNYYVLYSPIHCINRYIEQKKDYIRIKDNLSIHDDNIEGYPIEEIFKIIAGKVCLDFIENYQFSQPLLFKKK